MFCLNFSRSFVWICPPEALRCPPEFAFSRSFVAASRSFGRFASSESCRADIPMNSLLEFFSERKRKISPEYFLPTTAATTPFIGYLGLNL